MTVRSSPPNDAGPVPTAWSGTVAGVRHRYRTRLLAAVAVVGLLGAVLAVVSSGADGDVAAEPTTTVDRTDLDPAASELLGLLESGRDTTYHAVYRGTSPEVEGEIRLETWQSPPRIRQDSELTAQGTAVETRTIGDRSGVVRCGRIDGRWTCRRAADGNDPLGPISQASIEQLTRGSVGARDTTVDGRAVRCFSLRVEQGSSELCATAEGIVVRVSSAGSQIELVSLETAVDDDVFELPAEVTP